MGKSMDEQLTDMLARWHRWSAVRVQDTFMLDFDALINQVPPQLRTALAFHARNIATGFQVWSSVRVTGNVTHEAREYLKRLLSKDEQRWFGVKEIAVNERGNRIGESHQRAKLPDSDVQLLIGLGEQGYSVRWLAEKFEIGRSTAHDYLTGRLRAQVAHRVKRV